MKLVSYRLGKEPKYGVVVDNGIVDASARFGKQFENLRYFLDAGPYSELVGLVEETPDHSTDEISFDLPIPNARKILCVGRNYHAYHEVQKSGTREFPSIFARLAHSFAPHKGTLQVPDVCPYLDYECELAVIFGTSS